MQISTQNRKVLLNYISAIPGILMMILIFIRASTLLKWDPSIAGYYLYIEQFMVYLTLIEAGLVTVITAKMYRPMANQNYQQFNKIYSGSVFIYTNIAKVVTVIGIFAYILLPAFLIKNFNELNLSDIEKFLIYGLVLIKTIITISLVPTRSVFNSNQDDYIVNIIDGFVINFILATEIISIMYFKSIIPGLVIGIILKIIETIWLNRELKNRFHWLNKKIIKKDLTMLGQAKNSINIKFFETVFGTVDMIVISSFISSAAYTIFYTSNVIFERLFETGMTLFKPPLSTLGKIINIGTIKQKRQAYNYFFMLVLFVSSLITIVAYSIATPYVNFALSSQSQQANQLLLTAFAINMFYRMLNFPAYIGLDLAQRFQEKKRFFIPEIIMNVILSIILINDLFKLGIAGVIIATLISSASFNWWYLPKIFNHLVLQQSSRKHFTQIAKVTIIVLVFTVFITTSFRPLFTMTTIFDIIAYGFFIFVLALLYLTIVFYALFSEFKVILRDQIKKLFKILRRI